MEVSVVLILIRGEDKMKIKGIPINCVFLDFLMKENNITNAIVAKATGVSIATVSNWRRGAASPTPRNLILLARALKVDRHILLEDDIQKAQSQYRQTLYKSWLEDGIEAVDKNMQLQIMKILGLNAPPQAQKHEIEVKESKPLTEAEQQVADLIHGTHVTKSED